MTRLPALLLALLIPNLCSAQSPVTWQDTTKLADSALTIAYKRQVTVTDSTKLVRLVTATSGVPNGPFHLTPAQLCASPEYSASSLNVYAATLVADLTVAQGCGKRMVLVMRRSALKDTTGRISAVTASAELNSWPDITRFVQNGTVIAIYVGDDITATEWGIDVPLPVRLARMDSTALTARTRWPKVAVVVRAKPVAGELGDRQWKWLTTAWAQYRGPYRDGPPQKWADSMVTLAAKLGLGIIVGHNLLDGGCGPLKLLDGRTNASCLPTFPGTAILGTYINAATHRRYQSSALELGYYKTVFVSTAGVCGSIDWRESTKWTGGGRTALQVAQVQAFHTRADIRAEVKTIAVVARSKTPAPCVHPSRR